MAAVTVRAEGLTKRYGAQVAVGGVDLVAYEGEILGLLGPNGAGKTTTIRLLTTVLPPTAGRFSVAGVPSSRPREIRRRVGVLPESAGYPGRRTALEYLSFHAALFGLPATPATRVARALLAEVGLAERAHSPVGTFSRGMRQRLGIARALVNDPAVLFLDEPTLGLDPAGHRQVLGVLRAIARHRRATVVLSTHALSDVEDVCSRAVILDRGRVAASGTVAEVAGTVAGDPGATVTVPVELAGAARAVLERVAGLSVADIPDRTGAFVVSGPDRRPAEALRALVGAGLPILTYETHRARLDEAFLAVTGQRTR
ncbi:MAG: ABC transporter ATP-binding protein [Mycobacteriales bacterium]